MPGAVPELLERTWRSESASMLGVLSRRLGDLDRAADALQEAVAEALRRWPVDGTPEHPAGWLVTTAWRRAIDTLRRDATGREKLAQLAAEPEPSPTDDDRLALLFACCHPDLPVPYQIALTLYAVSGLSTQEVAAAFLVPTATMAQRLVRAKRQLREHGVRFDQPPAEEYPERLTPVLSVIYLLFNEGYLATSARPTTAEPRPGDAVRSQRRELATEALELARQLATLMPGEPEVAGLAALLELHEARAATRFDSWGRLVLLEDQDRRRWDHEAIAGAAARLKAAVARNRPGPYQVQAGIAAQHALAPSAPDTDWVAIRALYDRLQALAPSPVVLLSRAVATHRAIGATAALAEIEPLAGQLDGYRLFHATRAELLRALGREAEAREATGRALALATNPAERDLLARRLRPR